MAADERWAAVIERTHAARAHAIATAAIAAVVAAALARIYNRARPPPVVADGCTFFFRVPRGARTRIGSAGRRQRRCMAAAAASMSERIFRARARKLPRCQ